MCYKYDYLKLVALCGNLSSVEGSEDWWETVHRGVQLTNTWDGEPQLQCNWCCMEPCRWLSILSLFVCLSFCLIFQLYCCMKLSQWSACYWLLSPPVYAEHEGLSLYDVWSWDIAVNYLRCSFKITLFIFSSALWYILLGECKWHCWGEKPFSPIWMC